MGMFDELMCAYPLPRPEMQGHTFQTKDFDCALERYEITAAGRLRRYPHRLERNPEWKEPPPGDTSIRALRGMLIRIDEPPYEMPYHGDVYFYDFVDGGPLITFRARFTEGQLTSIVEVPEI